MNYCTKIRFTIGIIVIGCLGIGGLYGLNYFENTNKCALSMISEFPYISCEPIPSCIYCGYNQPFGGPFGTEKVKPLILLYPQSDTPVQVKLSYAPGFSAEYPVYNGGWSVVAHSDGTVQDLKSGQDTYGLFWEGRPSDADDFDLSKGFVVRGSEVRDFLYGKLREMGLNTKEYSDFITFWYPKLQNYPYVQITFAGKDYTDSAKLDISPKPDNLLRVFMVAKPLNTPIDIPPQTFSRFERTGFSVVEWGGTIIPE